MGNVSHVNNFSGVGRGRGYRVPSNNGSSTYVHEGGDTYIYPTKAACREALLYKMDKYSATRDNDYDSSHNYTVDYNSWIMATGYDLITDNIRSFAKREGREAYVQYTKYARWETTEGFLEYQAVKADSNKKQAFNKVCWAMFKTIRQAITLTTLQSNQALVATVQMDNELVEKVGEQGSTNQDSDKKENTIITRDQLETRSTHENTLSSMSRITTSEPQHNFESLVDRWMPLKAFNISINDKTGSMIQAYYIPENLYKSCAPNMLPFETFIYGEINCEFRLLTNANKFHVGKVVVSSKYDSYQVDRYCGTMQCALMRNHVIVDLTANNEAVLQVPFRYHNQYIRLNSQDASKGVRSGKYCSVYVHVLSPLQTGPDGPSDVGARMYYRLKKCSFAGMTYRIPITQMDTEVVLLKGAASLAKPLVRLAASTASEIVDDLGIEDIVHNVANISLKSQIKRIEDSFDQLGSSTNQDKPGKMSATIFVPKPKLNFCTGKGVTDIIPLRVNPLAQTNMAKVNLPLDEPRNFYDLARIYGLYQSFTIKNTDGEGTTLYNRVVDPFSRSYDSTYAGNPTPFEFAQGFFAFGSGPIDFRFDFVSNAYHTMTIQISAEFGRESTSQDICQSSSTYVKVFHLGEQKSVDFRVPYIYDTPFRRDTGSICNPYLGIMRNEQILQDSISIAPESRTRIKIKVINPLRPVSTAPKSIEVLVFIRAGKNYTMHGLKPASFVMPSTKPLDNFPQHYAPSTILGIKKNDPTYFDKAVISAGRNQWNEHSEGSLPLAVVQMDNGEKEDSDPTDNFNEGKCAMLALTNDCQMNFKDLLRRPVLLINGLTYKDGDGFQGFFMPCMPPQKDMCTSRDNGDNGVLDAGIIFHSTTGIVNMFRMFRGGSRWTLIVIPLESPYEPVYVTYIPHSGVRIFGEHTLTQWKEPTGDKLRKTKMNFYSHGYLTEVMIPHVNNMMTFETPYDTELPWTLIHEDNSALNYSWRDKGNTNCGHIVINCRSKIKFDLFWSAADDFELAGFYGIDRCVNDTNQYRYSDVHGKVQMDFLNDESNTMVSGFLNKTKRLVKLSNLSRYGLALVPGIGPGLVAASAANNLKDGLESAQGDVKLVREKLEQTADKFNVTMDTFTDLLNQVVNGLSDKLSGLMNGVSCLYDMILDIFISWSTKSWVPVGVGIVRFLSKAFIGKTEVVDIVLKYGLQLANWIQDWTSSVIPVVQSVDNTSTSTLVSILVGLVGTLVGVHLDPRQHRSYMRGLGERLTSSSGISYFVSVLRFIQGIFFSLKELVMEALGYVSVEARALRTLKEKNEIIAQFIDEAQLVTSEVNTSFLGVPSYRKRFWKVVLQAYQIQKLICQLPNNVASGQLARLCTEVVKIANEKFLDLAASPVRYEPFIIFLEGEPGVGKSFVSESIAAELLKSIGYTAPASGIVYQRTSGEKFWSGYRDQAVVVYDEFLNSNDSQRCMDFIVEFQKLKSTSTFIPEMAHLEEKKIRGNPLIVMVLCNGAFPNLADYARYPSAILRRREVVLRVERAEGFESLDLRQVDRNITKQFQHLSYLKYADVQDSKSLGTVRKNHVETLDYLTKRFQNWHAIETQNVQERMRKLPAFLANQDEINLEDPFTLFYTASEQLQVEGPNQNAWTPFEYLQAAVDQLNSVVVAHQARVTSPPQIPPNPTWETLNVRTESITSNIVGFLSAAVPLSWVVNMSINQLDSLEMSMLSTTEEMTECPVCLTQTVCCYACKDTILHEVQHRVCINCTRSLRTIGDGKCPLCRCDQLLPTMDSKNLMRLSIWGRLAIKGCRGLKWFLNKIVHWYNWRTNHPLLSLIGDYLMEVVYMTYQIISMDLSDPNCIPTINSLSTGMTCGRIYSAWYPDLVEFTHTMRAYVQNEWDDFQPTPSTSNDTGEIDRLDVNINPKVLDEYVSGFCDEVVCLHYLLDKNRSLMRLNKDHFECLDEKTNKFVSVSFYQCLDPSCPLKQSGYLQRIFSTYLQHHKLSLRQLYIDYINNPCKVTRNAIPEIFRLNSMSMIDIKIEQDWWTYITESYKKYKDLLLYISGAAMIVGGVISLYSMVNNTISSTQTDGGLMSSPGDQSPRYRRVKVRDRHQVRYFQSCDTPTVIDVVRKYIVKNTVKFTLGDLTQGKVMYGIGLFKHYVLIPKHYVRVILEGISKNKILYVELEGQPQMRTIMNLKASDVTYAEDVDAAYLRVPANIPLFKDLLKFFAKDEDLDKPLCADAELMLVPGRMREYFSMVPVEIEGVEPSRIIVDTDNNTFVAKDVLVYNYSKPGACGSLLLREHHQRPILSMHFAGAGLGSDGKGYGVILTQESLKPLSDIQNDVVQFDDVEYGSIEDAQFVYDDKVALGYLGTVKPDQVPYIPAKSRLVKSLIHGKPGLEVDIEPAILSKSDPRHKHMETPLYAGVRKHGLITKNFDQSELEWARQALWDCRYSSLRPLIANPQVLTESQAICGLEVEHYKKMDLATSAGYPYILSTKKKKSDYVTLELDEQLCPIRVTEFHPQLRKHLDENREKRKLGIIPQELYVDTLKDEKRPVEKLMQASGTRVFCNGPIHKVIEDRRFFMHFVATFMSHRFDLGHSVGINPLSSEWTLLTNRLLKHNADFMTLDYSNFGPGYNAGVAEMAYNIIVQWTIDNVSKPLDYSQEEYERTLRALVWNNIQSHHICSNTVYHQVAGSPSGSFFTTIINSIVNQIYFLLAWRKLAGEKCKKQGKSIVKEFFKNVELFVYGDDAIYTVSDEYKEVFNMRTIVKLFAQYNICATSSDKEALIEESEGLSKATFLKRGFLRHPTRDEWLSPLKWKSILSATQWVWASPNLKEATYINATAALLQSHGHGKQKYNELKELINKYLRKGKMPLVSDQWEDIDELFYEGHFIDIDTYINF